MFLSLAHNHIVDIIVDNGIEVQVTKDTNECVICASHFKISVTSDIDSSPLTLLRERVESSTLPAAKSPRVGIHNNRAPPIVVHG